MNEKVNKEIELFFLDLEDEILEKIKKTYERSLKDVQNKAKELQDELDKLVENVDPNDEIAISQIRSKVYQLGYQKNLEKQIANYMNIINDDDVKNVDDYLKEVYSNGFMSEQYRLMANGLNITMPINQKLLEKAVNTTFDDIPLSTRIYENVNKAKRNIISEISRGLSIGMSNQDMARNLKNSMGVSMRKAFQIAQNEGARVRQSAIYDNMVEAKKKGADIVKQWSATLDGKTRPVHQELDGQYAEIDEYFKYSGGKVFAPKQFGIASEDINCRCTLLTVPRWDITDKHWQRDNETKELVEVENYQDWYNKVYIKNVTAEIQKKNEQQIEIDKQIFLNRNNKSIEELRKELLEANGVQVPIEVGNLGILRGGNSIDKTSPQVKVKKIVFNKNDINDEHSIKTAYHELYHYKGEGIDKENMLKENLKRIEETMAECYGHYRATSIGAISDYICPSYSEYIISVLPRLKQLDEFKGCKTLQDFGKVAGTLRETTKHWGEISDKIDKISFNTFEYSKKYLDDIITNKEELIDKFMVACNVKPKYRYMIENDVSSVIEKLKNDVSKMSTNNEQVVYKCLISELMAKEGVK